MAGRRKKPKLRIDGVYYTTKIYTPEGKRTSISFGHVNDRTEAEVREEVQEALKVAKVLASKTCYFFENK